MKRTGLLSVLLLMTSVTGCMYELREEFGEFRINCATSRAARGAWSQSQDACMGISCPHSFKDGFIAGYKNVADGGTGCPPAIPTYGLHNHMWMDRCTEQEKMEAWYDGFEVGVISAKGDGAADVNRYVTRGPSSIPIDFSNTSPTPAKDSPDTQPVIPPAPLTEPETLSGPQTRR